MARADWTVVKSGTVVQDATKNGPSMSGSRSMRCGFGDLALYTSTQDTLGSCLECSVAADAYLAYDGDPRQLLAVYARCLGSPSAKQQYYKMTVGINVSSELELQYRVYAGTILLYSTAETLTQVTLYDMWHTFLFRVHTLANGNVLLAVFRKPSGGQYTPIAVAVDSVYKYIDSGYLGVDMGYAPY